eukprot:gnl/MRDRNA2_/MRDRNA2_105321_c0_seq1.p1 gnl/MRDRNA2_/MRDRNA2_105321_c0~~gnl/MRDRNA2_/MRDRNA2_105321_c0_seq1.p1  ORF type:complete len:529 (+),score=83.58 gnl/MRDRNA2_/MRDRNA2_105321_c0_seq1:75-1661(+)
MCRHQQNMPIQKASFKEDHPVNISNHFDVQSVIGEGVFSIAYRAVDKATGKVVAIKTYKPGSLEHNQRFERQVQILKELQKPVIRKSNVEHPCLQMLAWERDPRCYIVLEMGTCDLAEYAKKQPVLARQGIRQLGHNLLRGAAALHTKGLVHLDIKPQNFMLFGNQWKLIDVEGCIHAGKCMPQNGGAVACTPGYCSPEFARAYLKPHHITEIVFGMDIWSVGMTLAEVATQNSPLQVMFSQLQRQGQTLQQASEAVLSWVANTREAPVFQTEGMDVRFQNLLYKWMLVLDIDGRRQLAECMDHDFFVATDPTQSVFQKQSDEDATGPCSQTEAQEVKLKTLRKEDSENFKLRPKKHVSFAPEALQQACKQEEAQRLITLISPRPLPAASKSQSSGHSHLPESQHRFPVPVPNTVTEPAMYGSVGDSNHFREGQYHSPRFGNPAYPGAKMVPNNHHHVPSEGQMKGLGDLGEVLTKNSVRSGAQETRSETEQTNHQHNPSCSKYLLPSWIFHNQEYLLQEKNQPQLIF